MADFKVILPTTTEEWQRDMIIAYNQALDDLFKKCKELSCKESLETDSYIEFNIVELEDIEQAIDELKR